MLSFYLDNCVLVPLFVTEPASELVKTWITAQDRELTISNLTAGEFGSAISRLVRMDRITLAEAQAINGYFDQWREAETTQVDNGPIDIRVAARFVRQPHPKLLMPDAIHLATCQRLGQTLVTLDNDLAEIAENMGLPYIVPQ